MCKLVPCFHHHHQHHISLLIAVRRSHVHGAVIHNYMYHEIKIICVKVCIGKSTIFDNTQNNYDIIYSDRLMHSCSY